MLRLSTAHSPWVVAIHRAGQVEVLAAPVALPELLQDLGAKCSPHSGGYSNGSITSLLSTDDEQFPPAPWPPQKG